MALVVANLERTAGGLQRIHLYNGGADAIATIVASGYFNLATSNLRQGDVIHCVHSNNTGLRSVVVTSATGAATVTVAAAA